MNKDWYELLYKKRNILESELFCIQVAKIDHIITHVSAYYMEGI